MFLTHLERAIEANENGNVREIFKFSKFRKEVSQSSIIKIYDNYSFNYFNMIKQCFIKLFEKNLNIFFIIFIFIYIKFKIKT